MKLLSRVSKLLTANVNHLLDSAEDPSVMIKQLIRDMDEAVTDLRRETVNAVAREKQLARKIIEANELAGGREEKAKLALDHGNEDLARRLLAERVDSLKLRDTLTQELEAASEIATQLKRDLVRMEEQAALARRKKDELIRRQRSAESQLRTREAAQRTSAAMSAATGATAFQSYADEIGAMEAQAEAARELTAPTDDGESELTKLVQDSEVDKELERLKKSS